MADDFFNSEVIDTPVPAPEVLPPVVDPVDPPSDREAIRHLYEGHNAGRLCVRP